MVCFTHRLHVLALACLYLFGLAVAALADEPPPVAVGFGGLYRPGPVPIRVRLVGGATDLDGSLDVDVSDGIGLSRYSVPITLAKRAKKSILVHTSLSHLLFPATITWRPLKGEPQTLPDPAFNQVGGPLVVVASADPLERSVTLPNLTGRTPKSSTSAGALNVIISAPWLPLGNSTQQTAMEPSLLPDAWYDYSSVDLLYLRRVGAQDLTDAQLAAIETWMEAGGQVLVSGGPSAVEPLSRFVPGRITGRVTKTRLDALSQVYGGAKLDEKKKRPPPHELSVLEPEAGAVVALREDDVPLVTYARRGAGGVAFLAFDPLTEPFASSPGLGRLWDETLARVPRRDSACVERGFQNDMVELLCARQGPSVSTVVGAAALLVCFLVGLGWVHRRIAASPSRLFLAVLGPSCLAITVAFAALAIGSLGHSGDRRDGIVFLQAAPGARHAVVHAFDAFWHPATGTYQEVATRGDTLCLSEVSPVFDPRRRARLCWAELAAPRLVYEESFPNSSRIFCSLSLADIGQGIESRLLLTGPAPQGSIANRTPWDWKDVRLFSLDGEARLGDLPRGREMRSFPQVSPGGDEEMPLRDLKRAGRLHDALARRMRLDWRFPSKAVTAEGTAAGDLLLVAFLDRVPVWQPGGPREESQETVLVVPLLGCDQTPGGTGR